MKISVLLCLLCLWCGAALAAPPPFFAVAVASTPVFNNQAVAAGRLEPPDHCGQHRQLEFIALPGTVFTVIDGEPTRHGVIQVTTTAYQPAATVRLYVAAQQLRFSSTRPEEGRREMPEPEQILQRLRSAVGRPYIWGGNLRDGLMLNGARLFAGLDCSGLLYEATDGMTPRNTSDLLKFGRSVSIEGLGVEGLLKRLQPLDLIVWQGHVVIVLDQQTAIESILRCRGGFSGVIITPLRQRLEQVQRRRIPADSWPMAPEHPKQFVVRRWR